VAEEIWIFKLKPVLSLKVNKLIVNDLKYKLKEVILPDCNFEIEQEWQGIMGFSESKSPVMMKLNAYTTYIMACNGMGVALSPFMAKELVAGL
jgi:gamma-glutamylputrescine oxidase